MAKKTAKPKSKVKAKAKAKAKAAPARKAKKSARSFTGWSPADVQKLRKIAGKVSTTQVAKSLNRSVAAVTFKAFSLRLSLRLAHSSRGRRLKVSKR